MIARDSSLQVAEREIARGLLEGPENDFFRGWGDRIVCADRGDAQTAVQEALANLGVCIGIKATGGPVGRARKLHGAGGLGPHRQIVPTHRTEDWNGKATDGEARRHPGAVLGGVSSATSGPGDIPSRRGWTGGSSSAPSPSIGSTWPPGLACPLARLCALSTAAAVKFREPTCAERCTLREFADQPSPGDVP